MNKDLQSEIDFLKLQIAVINNEMGVLQNSVNKIFKHLSRYGREDKIVLAEAKQLLLDLEELECDNTDCN